MSSTAAVTVIAFLDLAVIAGLAAVCLVPFRLGRRPRSAGAVLPLAHDPLEPSRWAA